MKVMKIKLQKQDAFIILAFVMMLILFISSSMTYHQQTSVPFLEKYLTGKPFETFLERFSLDYSGSEISIQAVGYYKFLEFFIRKGAHFGTYFLLGSFLYLGIKDRMNVKWLAAFLCVLASLGYAATDEFHQMITGDRTPLFQDVMLDGTGALCGILLCILCELIYLRVKRKEN